MSLPAISVVIPFRNSGSFIERALDSIAKQTFPHFEVVMVNNRSGDSSVPIARSFADSDDRFRLLGSDGGYVEALNHGLEQARGKWVARFDSDDICHPERLSLQFAAAEALGEKTVVSCRIRSFPDPLVSGNYRRYEAWINGAEGHTDIEHGLFIESPIPHPTAFYSRKGILDAGGYLDAGLPEDYELWLRLWSMGYGFHRVPRTLVAWREHEDRFSRRSSMYSQTSFYRTKAKYLGLVPCMSAKVVCIAGFGQCAKRLSGHLLREGFSVRAFLSPFTSATKPLLRGIPVVSAEAWHPEKGVPVLCASRKSGAREKMREFLQGRGLVNWRDFILCS